MQNASNHRKTGDFSYYCASTAPARSRLEFSLSDTLAPPLYGTRHGLARASLSLLVVRMTSSKAEDSWTEPEGVLCRLYKSDLVKFGVNLS